MLTEEEFQRLNSLTEEEFAVESNSLSEEEFFEFVERKGTMTSEELDAVVFKMIEEMWGEKL